MLTMQVNEQIKEVLRTSEKALTKTEIAARLGLRRTQITSPMVRMKAAGLIIAVRVEVCPTTEYYRLKGYESVNNFLDNWVGAAERAAAKAISHGIHKMKDQTDYSDKDDENEEKTFSTMGYYAWS